MGIYLTLIMTLVMKELDWIAMIENTVNNGHLQHKKYDLSFQFVIFKIKINMMWVFVGICGYFVV